MNVSGNIARDDGMDRVLTKVPQEWQDRYSTMCANYLCRNQFATGEDIRDFCLEQGLKDPHHVNVWGAMWNSIIRSTDWVTETNEWIQARRVESHSRWLRFWRSQIFRGKNAEEVTVYRLPSGPNKSKS